MIVINQSAKELDFCGNGLQFKVDTSNAFSSEGVYAELVITVVSTVVTGNIISFKYADKEIIFTVAAAIDFSGKTILNGSTASSITDCLKNNYLLQKYFTFKFLTNKITITAKEKGSSFSLTFFSNSANVVQFHNTIGTERILRTGYKTLCDLFLERENGSNLFENIAGSLYGIDDTGRCIVKPGKILSKYFYDIDLPDLNQSIIKKVTKTVKRYYLKFAEFYNNSAQLVKTSSVLYAVDGTVNKDIYSDTFAYHSFALFNKNYLLDFKIDKIETWAEANQFLYFVSYLPSVTITQKVKVYFTDGTNIIVTKSIFPAAIKNECFIIPCGYIQLNLAAVNPAKEVYKYEVYLESAGTLLAKHITYYLLDNPLYGKEFWFKNQMGAMEALLCERQIHKLDVKRSELLNEDSYLTSVEEIKDSYECSTGNKTKKEIEHLSEFVISNAVFMLLNGNIYNVSIEANSYSLFDENEDLFTFKFNYRITGIYNPAIVISSTPGSMSNAFSGAFARS